MHEMFVTVMNLRRICKQSKLKRYNFRTSLVKIKDFPFTPKLQDDQCFQTISIDSFYISVVSRIQSSVLSNYLFDMVKLYSGFS